jgi:hypothetical protein
MVLSLLPYSMKLANYIPLTWFQNLVNSRKALIQQAKSCVSRSIAASEKERNKSLLSYVIEAKDPDTGDCQNWRSAPKRSVFCKRPVTFSYKSKYLSDYLSGTA